MNIHDTVAMSIDSLLDRNELVNNLNFNLVDNQGFSIYAEMPRDFFKIEMKPEEELTQLEIKEILFHNDKGEYIAYSFL